MESDMTELNTSPYKHKKGKWDIIRWVALIMMVMIFISIILIYPEIIKYNALTDDPCALCEELNTGIYCEFVTISWDSEDSNYLGIENADNIHQEIQE